MNPIIRPHKVLSFEDALRNLASRLTGTPVAELPRTQEAIVQYMAENVKLPEAPAPELPGVDIDKLCEAITKEVMARTAETVGANLAATEPSVAAQDGVENAGGTSTPPAAETATEAPQTATEPPKPKTTRKTTKAKA